MTQAKKNFNIYFENRDLSAQELFSGPIIKSLVRSMLEPLALNNQPSVVFLRLKDDWEATSLIKRLEYSSNVELKVLTDFDFSKFDVEETGIVILTSQRFNCAFLFKEVEKDRFQIHLKINSKLVSDVYETLKSIFLINYDEKFYQYRPERRENELMNDAVSNVLKHFEETIVENEYNTKIKDDYSEPTQPKDDYYNQIRPLIHEIKNQLSVLDIYTKVLEKKSIEADLINPIRKSIDIIRSQIEQLKDAKDTNLVQKDIKGIIQESIKTYSLLLKEKNNKIVFIDELAGLEAEAYVDEAKLLMALNNIINNASDSTQNDEIIVKLSKIEDKIKISIINHGEAIEKDNFEKIFQEGFTTKKDGWGEGLSASKKFIESQFGILELTKSDSKSTEFSILLPSIQIK